MEHEGTPIAGTLLRWVEAAALGIEVLAVAAIVIAISYATVGYVLARSECRADRSRAIDTYRGRLGQALLVGLELLVTADIIRTVALESTFQSIGLLGLLVLIRTFLSWSLVVEVDGRWPWQGAVERPPAEPAAGRTTNGVETTD